MDKILGKKIQLNGICPYFTMFPLDFPYRILEKHAAPGEWVADPFCGRGTTNYASRVLGLPSVGIDSNPVAVAISRAKLSNTTPQSIMLAAKYILDIARVPSDVPTGEFWRLAYHPEVLQVLCRLREGLLMDCRSQSRLALRGILLGALHGPRNKTGTSYFSNQSQRTYAPKPTYAINYWKRHGLTPENVDVLQIIETRAQKYYSGQRPATGTIVRGDSREESSFRHIQRNIRWVITSPPYYGMTTYIPDQWIRAWFLGGKPTVDYSTKGQLQHSSPEVFAAQLRQVWINTGQICEPEARMVVRLGGINDRQVDPLRLLDWSLAGSGWYIERKESAGYASQGRRQANHINRSLKEPREEYDIWAIWRGLPVSHRP